MKPNQLNPTLWRTARALANPDRLNLMYLVANAKGEKGVVELAGEAGLPVPTASTYLRAQCPWADQCRPRGVVRLLRDQIRSFASGRHRHSRGFSTALLLQDASEGLDVASASAREGVCQSASRGSSPDALSASAGELRGTSPPRRVLRDFVSSTFEHSAQSWGRHPRHRFRHVRFGQTDEFPRCDLLVFGCAAYPRIYINAGVGDEWH